MRERQGEKECVLKGEERTPVLEGTMDWLALLNPNNISRYRG